VTQAALEADRKLAAMTDPAIAAVAAAQRARIASSLGHKEEALDLLAWAWPRGLVRVDRAGPAP
jgi:hypothetical protein